jgi:hypothetical protein
MPHEIARAVPRFNERSIDGIRPVFHIGRESYRHAAHQMREEFARKGNFPRESL